MSISSAALKFLPTPTVNSEPTRPYMMTTKSYRKEAPNARALVQVNAWLKAVGIITKPLASGADLSIETKSGGTLEVVVAISYNDPIPATGALLVLASELTSKHSATAMKAFHSITVASGHGTPNPLNRGPEPLKKLHFDDNFELVSMRHKEFRRVPNPTADELVHFDRVIQKAIGRFMYINAVICRRNMIQFEDLKSYAQVWTCNYLGLFKVANPTVNDNERKLYAYLCQRFTEMAKMLVKKQRNCLPDSETASIAFYGTVNSPSFSRRAGECRQVDESDTTFEEFTEAELTADVIEVEEDPSIPVMTYSASEEAEQKGRIQKLSENKRRKWASELLGKLLSDLGHDEMVSRLEEVLASAHLGYDARMEARKQLRLHREDCASCAEVKKQLAREQSLGA